MSSPPPPPQYGMRYDQNYPPHISHGARPVKQRKPSLKAPFLFILFYALAIGVGVAHHFFYAILDGQVVENQAVRASNQGQMWAHLSAENMLSHFQWIIRAGTAIAYLAKLLFVASIGAALTQQLWRSLRSKAFSLGAIDKIFNLKNSPENLFNSEINSKATVVVLLSVSIWHVFCFSLYLNIN
jgi:hypothetical protein